MRTVAGAVRLGDAFARARAERRTALVAYLMTGYPDLATSAAAARAALEAGADVLELGVPFSDPMADGTTIQRAGERALANGVTLRGVLEVARGLAGAAPVVLMGYANPFFRMGLEALVSRARGAGIAGFIVPDLPDEESAEFDRACAGADLVRVSLVAPTTPEERLARLVPRCAGFVYCVSLTGVTGARRELGPDVADFLRRVRAHARVPVAVGFGISRPEHVAALAGLADGVVVGSALVDAMDGAADPIASVGALVRDLRAAGVQG